MDPKTDHTPTAISITPTAASASHPTGEVTRMSRSSCSGDDTLSIDALRKSPSATGPAYRPVTTPTTLAWGRLQSETSTMRTGLAPESDDS